MEGTGAAAATGEGRVGGLRGGVRQRLGKTAAPAPAPPQPAATGGGGVRQRLGTTSDEHAASSSARGGGIKRKLAALAGETTSPDLPFNKALRRDWSAGKISSKTVVEYAMKASHQGAAGADALAGDSRNAHRHLLSAIGYPAAAPEIDWIEVPDKHGRLQAHPIICPLKWFEKVAADCQSRFEKVLLGSQRDVDEFWQQLQGHVIYEKNIERIDVHKSIPCTLHGDGAPTTKVDGLFSISWSSLLGTGTTIETRHVFTVLQKSMMSNDTLHAVFRRLAWAFNALAVGRMPQRDWTGNRLSDAGRVLGGGWRLAMIGLRGDWEFFSQACGFPTSTSVPCMCFICKASPHLGDLTWTRGDDEAPWRATLRSHEGYIRDLAAQGKPVPSLFQIHTLRLEGVFGDAMHTMDLGVASHLCGNIMHEVMESQPWGANQEQRAAVLNEKLNDYYKRTKEKHRIDGRLTFARIKKSGDWPKFLGKAASTRRLAVFCLELACRFDSGSEHDKLRKGTAVALVRIYDILCEEPRFMSPSAKLELSRLSKAFMGMWARLSAHALANRVRAWKMSPKFHLMQHILEHQSFINPRCTWVYGDEDLQRILKEVACSCHPRNTPHMVLFKWAVNTFDD
jgi:hypothetical protein